MMPFRALKTAKKCHPRYEYELADPEPGLMSFAISYLGLLSKALDRPRTCTLKNCKIASPILFLPPREPDDREDSDHNEETEGFFTD